jgi:hypothetical protein
MAPDARHPSVRTTAARRWKSVIVLYFFGFDARFL